MHRIITACLVAAFAFTAPMSSQAQATAVGSICKDGFKDKTVGRGACARHGGVDVAATEKANAAAMKAAAKDSAKAAKAQARADAKAAKAEARVAANAKKTEAAAAVGASTAKPARRTDAPKPAAAMASAATSEGGSVNNVRADATAKCKDGTYSHAKTHKGACSRHGGVAEWYKQ